MRVVVTLAALALASSAAAGESVAPAPAAGIAVQPPTGEEIFRRFASALGGATALASHHAYHASGILEIPSQKSHGTYGIVQASSGAFVTHVDFEDFGRSEAGWDGRMGWSRDPHRGSRVLVDPELTQMRMQPTDVFQFADPRRSFQVMETDGNETLDGVETWRVKVQTSFGARALAYFETATGMLHAVDVKVASPYGDLLSRTVFSNWKRTGGVLVPMHVATTTAGMEQDLTLSTYQFDPPHLPPLKAPPDFHPNPPKPADP